MGALEVARRAAWPIMIGYDPGARDTTALTVATARLSLDGTVIVVISSSNDVTSPTATDLASIAGNTARTVPLVSIAPPRAPGRYEPLPPRPPPAAPLERTPAIRVPRRLLHRRSHCG